MNNTAELLTEQRFAEITKNAEAAIRSNFACRNILVFSSPKRSKQIAQDRHRQLREWITVLRILRNPELKNAVRREVPNSPLAPHHLRRRIILAAIFSRNESNPLQAA